MPGNEVGPMFRFEAHRYSSLKTFAHVKVFEDDRLVAIVRQPPKTIPMIKGLQGERPDHWRVDCDQNAFDPSIHQALKDAVGAYLQTDKVSMFGAPGWSWIDKRNTEPYQPIEGELQRLSV